MTELDKLAAFWAWFAKHYDGGMPMNPDPEDFDAVRRDHPAPATTETEVERRFKLAQAAKLSRIYKRWEASQVGGSGGS